MKKIPFDIKFRQQIESGEYKVVTSDDRPVRIISWDKKVFGGRVEMVVLVPTLQGDTETIQLYYPDGTLIASGWNEKFKLFIVTPEPELSEFAQEVRVCVTKNLTTHIKEGNGREMSCTVFIDDETTKKMAAELLDLARKELEPEFDAAYKNQDEVVFMNGVKKGREEAMKDMPRWHHLESGVGGDAWYPAFLVRSSKDHYFLSNCIGPNTTYLNLPDLEKLPGLED